MNKKTILSFEGEEHELKPVGKVNKQTLWLARDDDRWYRGDYVLFVKRPIRTHNHDSWSPCKTGKAVLKVGAEECEAMFPTLTLAPGKCIEVELTVTDKGVRLERQ